MSDNDSVKNETTEGEEMQLSDTQNTEPPLTEEEYSILRSNMSGMSSTFQRLIEPSEAQVKWSESNQELFNELTRADTLENNPGFVNPNQIFQPEIVDGESSRDDKDTFTLIQNFQPILRHTLSFPSTEQFPGEYGFHCVFEKLNSNYKNKFWEFSQKLNKLYIEFNKNIQICFKLKPGKDCSDLFVRAMVVYAEEASVKEPVLRCPTHSSHDHETNLNFPPEYIQHIIRADHKGALYFVDDTSKRHSVLVPISKPAVGTDYCPRIFKFMCLCSDSGGINRRPVKLIFTLEKGLNVVSTIGRDSLDLRICACPGRDMFKEEKKLRQKEEMILRHSSEVKNSTKGLHYLISPSSQKKRKLEMEEMVLIPVAKRDYEKLNEFAEAAMIVRHPEQKEIIRNERRRLMAKCSELNIV
ncbi:cellular tumor antigen p53 isoform X1 [Lepeophtheirus salmonis]|uniref:cellular tumor antigen p53 isoform X1 n=1 Tax=Lepeophtheirus salmonis TaxID=72036 RepID=UPI001AE798C7|nr:cellular tumor antigen p53-like isoform X1 [Lepeophtheirus salmonis]